MARRTILLACGLLAACDRSVVSTKDQNSGDLADSDAADTDRPTDSDVVPGDDSESMPDTVADTMPGRDTDAALETDTDQPVDSDAATDTHGPPVNESDSELDTEEVGADTDTDLVALPYGGDVCLWLADNLPATIPPGKEIYVACGASAACDDVTWFRIDVATFVAAMGWCLTIDPPHQFGDTGLCDDTAGLPDVRINCTLAN